MEGSLELGACDCELDFRLVFSVGVRALVLAAATVTKVAHPNLELIWRVGKSAVRMRACLALQNKGAGTRLDQTTSFGLVRMTEMSSRLLLFEDSGASFVVFTTTLLTFSLFLSRSAGRLELLMTLRAFVFLLSKVRLGAHFHGSWSTGKAWARNSGRAARLCAGA